MRDLNEFYYLAQYIDQQIESKMKDTRSQFVKVKKTDGVFCDCELVKAQDGVKEFKNIPIIQSGRFHYSTKEGDFGLMLNVGQAPAEFFTTGTLKGAILDLPFYLFLPIQTRIDGVTNQLKKDNVIIADCEKTVSVKMDQQAGLTIESQKAISIKDAEGLTIESQKAISIKDAEGLTIESQKAISIKDAEGLTIESQKAISMKANPKIDLNGSSLGSTLSKLSSDLNQLSTLLKSSPVAGQGAPLAIVWQPTSASDLTNIASKLD